MTMTTMVHLAVLVIGMLCVLTGNTIDAWVVTSPPQATTPQRMIRYHPQRHGSMSTPTTYRTTTATTMLLASSHNATETTETPEEQQPSPEQTTTEKEKKKGYVRVEEWNAQHKADLQWEERVKFDGKKHGNGWQQNEILRQNLFK